MSTTLRTICLSLRLLQGAPLVTPPAVVVLLLVVRAPIFMFMERKLLKLLYAIAGGVGQPAARIRGDESAPISNLAFKLIQSLLFACVIAEHLQHNDSNLHGLN